MYTHFNFDWYRTKIDHTHKFYWNGSINNAEYKDDLGWPWRAIIHSATLYACFSRAITKIWMKIDPYYQQWKCSAETLVCEDISLCRFSWGFAGWGRGIKWEWCRRKLPFLLLARYVSNVAKRSIWDQCKKYILRTDRPTTDQRPHVWKISNGHISARRRPIHFMFGSRTGFSGSADRMALIPVWPNSIGMWENRTRDE